MIDLCTREVVGWSMADHMRTELVADAIRMAHAGGHTAGNAIFHSDRGSQYTSHQFRLLGELDIRQSAGRTGSCFDNAAAESFFAVLKAEIGTTAWETGLRPGRTFSGGSRNITTGSGSTRPSATSRRTRRGSAAINGWTSRHKRKCWDLRGHFTPRRHPPFRPTARAADRPRCHRQPAP